MGVFHLFKYLTFWLSEIVCSDNKKRLETVWAQGLVRVDGGTKKGRSWAAVSHGLKERGKTSPETLQSREQQ